VRDSSFSEPNGDRVLQESIDVATSPACLWRALTDEQAIKASGMPMAHVDLRNGGVLEEGFAATAQPGGPDTIRHEIVAYLPERLLVLRNQSTPPGLPHADLYRRIVQLDLIEPIDGGRTRITLSHTGYGAGADWDQLYAFFRNGNAAYLLAMKKACEADH
jgi:uncharacterized protein YndB with AHSA1/START domain